MWEPPVPVLIEPILKEYRTQVDINYHLINYIELRLRETVQLFRDQSDREYLELGYSEPGYAQEELLRIINPGDHGLIFEESLENFYLLQIFKSLVEKAGHSPLELTKQEHRDLNIRTHWGNNIWADRDEFKLKGQDFFAFRWHLCEDPPSDGWLKEIYNNMQQGDGLISCFSFDFKKGDD